MGTSWCGLCPCDSEKGQVEGVDYVLVTQNGDNWRAVKETQFLSKSGIF